MEQCAGVSRVLAVCAMTAMMVSGGGAQTKAPDADPGSLAAHFPAANDAPAIQRAETFVVYDNMFYSNRPDTSPLGMIGLNILYEKDLWGKDANEAVLPPREQFDRLARQATRPGPLVLDVELLILDSAEKEAVLETLVQWAHEDCPGKAVGYYGMNTLTKVKAVNLPLARKLAAHVDAMFPPMYTYNRDEEAWAWRARLEVEEAHALAPGKPVYFYLQPQYHHTTPLAYQYVEQEYWAFELQTAREMADGVVIWTGSRWPWNDAAGWWAATRGFLKTLPAGTARQGGLPH